MNKSLDSAQSENRTNRFNLVTTSGPITSVSDQRVNSSSASVSTVNTNNSNSSTPTCSSTNALATHSLSVVPTVYSTVTSNQVVVETNNSNVALTAPPFAIFATTINDLPSSCDNDQVSITGVQMLLQSDPQLNNLSTSVHSTNVQANHTALFSVNAVHQVNHQNQHSVASLASPRSSTASFLHKQYNIVPTARTHVQPIGSTISSVPSAHPQHPVSPSDLLNPIPSIAVTQSHGCATSSATAVPSQLSVLSLKTHHPSRSSSQHMTSVSFTQAQVRHSPSSPPSAADASTYRSAISSATSSRFMSLKLPSSTPTAVTSTSSVTTLALSPALPSETPRTLSFLLAPLHGSADHSTLAVLRDQFVHVQYPCNKSTDTSSTYRVLVDNILLLNWNSIFQRHCCNTASSIMVISFALNQLLRAAVLTPLDSNLLSNTQLRRVTTADQIERAVTSNPSAVHFPVFLRLDSSVSAILAALHTEYKCLFDQQESLIVLITAPTSNRHKNKELFNKLSVFLTSTGFVHNCTNVFVLASNHDNNHCTAHLLKNVLKLTCADRNIIEDTISRLKTNCHLLIASLHHQSHPTSGTIECTLQLSLARERSSWSHPPKPPTSSFWLSSP